MKKNCVHCTLILDRSGSMQSIRSDVIGGVNAFLKEQRELPGECTFTLVQFDDAGPYDVLCDFKPIKEAKDLGDEYLPRGLTPLCDAVGKGIVSLGEKLRSLPEADRPEKVVFVTMTDGLENASKEYDRARIAVLTKEQQEKYGWQFVYLGANQDAVKEAESVGIPMAAAANYSEQKTSGAIKLASANLRSYRSGAKADMAWSAEQRKQLS